MTKKLEVYNITPEQLIVVNKLAEEEGVSQKELAIKLDKDQNTVKAIIDKLVRNGYVLRSINERDRRAFTLFLGERAKKDLAEIRELESKCMQEIYQGIDLDILENISRDLEILRKNINNELKK